WIFVQDIESAGEQTLNSLLDDPEIDQAQAAINLIRWDETHLDIHRSGENIIRDSFGQLYIGRHVPDILSVVDLRSISCGVQGTICDSKKPFPQVPTDYNSRGAQ